MSTRALKEKPWQRVVVRPTADLIERAEHLANTYGALWELDPSDQQSRDAAELLTEMASRLTEVERDRLTAQESADMMGHLFGRINHALDLGAAPEYIDVVRRVETLAAERRAAKEQPA